MRFRRHIPRGLGLMDWIDWLTDWLEPVWDLLRKRRFVVWIGSFVSAFLVGYVLAALVLFPAPIFASTKVVPRILGLAQSAAAGELAASGLTTGEIDNVTHPTAPRGQVVWQDPPPGTAVPERTTIRLSVSSGPQRVPVPDLGGYDAGLAAQLIVAAGLRVARIDATQAPVPRDVVINTRPPAGTALTPGTGITLVVSVGAPTITVPNLAGLTRQQADSTLELVNLTLGTFIWRTSNVGEHGSVIEQDPAAGTLSAPGTAVNITLARRRSL